MAAALMHQAGYKIIGIAEVGGGLLNTNGIDLKALVDFRQKNGTVHGFPGAEKCDPADLLVAEIDGYYGPRTAQAVEAFQRDYGLIADGMVGKQTLTQRLRGSATRK